MPPLGSPVGTVADVQNAGAGVAVLLDNQSVVRAVEKPADGSTGDEEATSTLAYLRLTSRWTPANFTPATVEALALCATSKMRVLPFW